MIEECTVSINAYKNYLRFYQPNNIRGTILEKFVWTLEANENIQSLYNELGLIDDLHKIESQYFLLRQKIDFLPFIESLLNRTNVYASNFSGPHDYQVALRTLYTATMSKIVTIKNIANRISVVNLVTYLEIIQSNVRRLLEIEKESNMVMYQAQYEKVLDDKIKVALELVQNDIIPQVKRYMVKLDEQITQLIKEIRELIREELKNKEELEEKRSKLEASFWLGLFSGILRIMAAVVSCFGRVGSIFSAASLFTSNQNARFTWKNYSINRTREEEIYLLELAHLLNSSLAEVKKEVAQEHELFLMLLIDIERELKDADNWANRIKEKIAELKPILEDRLKSDDILDQNEVFEWRDEFDKILEQSIPITTLDRAKYDKNKKAKNNVDKFNKISKAGKDMYNVAMKNLDSIEEVERAIEAVKKRIEYIKQIQLMICNTLVPAIQEIRISILDIIKSVNDKSVVELDIAKWQIQRTLRDTKSLMRELAEETTLVRKLERMFEKIAETMSILIEVFDRIESYKEQIKFSRYLADIFMGGPPKIEDPTLYTIVFNLRQAIETNLILEQLDIAIEAFKQHQFPFGQYLLSVFELPADLRSNNRDTLAKRVNDQVHHLKSQIQPEGLTIGKYDREVFGNVDFSSRDSSVAIPFYTWRYFDMKYDFDRFLDGEEIFVRADIRKGVNMNAVKFNEIGLRFVASNPEAQHAIDSELNNNDYTVSMAMFGNSYYKCADRFYSTSVDENLVFEYSTKKTKDGHSSKVNEVYRKIKNKNYFISPYTMWKIQVKKERSTYLNYSFSKQMNGFQNQNKPIRIDLVGRGQFFTDGMYSSEVCTEELDRFYTYEGPTFTHDNRKSLKFQYSMNKKKLNEKIGK